MITIQLAKLMTMQQHSYYVKGSYSYCSAWLPKGLLYSLSMKALIVQKLPSKLLTGG